MITLISRASAGLLLAFSLLIGACLISTANSPAETLLLGNETCGHPCFLGIQPGITPVRQARQMLESHPWISNVDIEFTAMERSLDRIVWSWSGEQPDMFDGGRSGMIIVGPERETVGQIMLPMRLNLGEVHLLVGQPPFFTIGTSQYSQPRLKLEIEEFHIRHGFYLHVETYCPLWMSTLWLSAIDSITFFDASGDLMRSYFDSPPTPLQEYRRAC